jgi:hypothetical protein
MLEGEVAGEDRSEAAQAVTSTMVSPERTMTEPSACLARRPVSIDNVCRPTEMLRVCIVCLSLRSWKPGVRR